jgi:hypothetical protein
MKRLLIFLLLLPVSARADPSAFGGAVGGPGGGGGQWTSVMTYGAVADAKTITDISMPAVNQVTSTGTTFTSADVGKSVIVRGATSVNTGSMGSISPWYTTIASVSGNTATMSDSATNTLLNNFSAGSFARMDYGTDNINAFNAAVTALPAAGGTVYIPAGNYMFAMSTEAHRWAFSRNNVSIIGAGMGQTVIYYGSGSTEAGGRHGCCLITGADGPIPFYNTTVQDFTIWDLAYYQGNGGNGINILYTHNVRVERIEAVNCKGNASINLQGGSPGGMNGVIIRDCYIHGNSVDGWLSIAPHGIQGDGINAGQIAHARIMGNYIIGPGRQGYEGGGNCYDQYISNNTVDMQNGGLSGINPTGANNTIVANNVVMNVNAGAHFDIDFTVDVGTTWTALNNVVTGNYCDGSGQAILRMQNTSGDTTATHINNYVISDNIFINNLGGGPTAIFVTGGSAANDYINALVQNNYISVVGGSAIVTPNTGWSATPPAGRMFVFKNNTCNAPPFEMFSWPANGVICEDNTITNGWGNWNRYGTMNTASGFVSVAAGATGSVTTVLEGARATLDTIVCVPQAATALIIWGNVSSNDNVTVYAYNPTAGALTPPSVKYYAKRAAANF